MRLLNTILLFLASVACFAQAWSTSGTNIYNTNSGNVGIGTTSPSAKVTIAGSLAERGLYVQTNDSWIAYSDGNNYLRGNTILADTGPNQKVGIGISLPRGKLDVVGGDIYLSDGVNSGTYQNLFLPGSTYLSPYGGGNVSYLQARRQDNSGTTSLRLRTYNNGSLTEAMHIEGNGNVGIGTTDPKSFKLAVNGNVWAREVQVALDNPGPDYVFEKDYKLPTLEDIKTYIEKNKHLPEVPSAKEMETNGVNLGDMNMLLLKKIEELTLYVIELKKENVQIKEENQRQNKLISEMKK